MDAVQKSGKIINEDPRLLESLWKTSSEKKLGHSDLKNDLLTSTTSEGALWIFSKITFLKSVHQAEKNEL